jgi:hypothetical protein
MLALKYCTGTIKIFIMMESNVVSFTFETHRCSRRNRTIMFGSLGDILCHSNNCQMKKTQIPVSKRNIYARIMPVLSIKKKTKTPGLHYAKHGT